MLRWMWAATLALATLSAQTSGYSLRTWRTEDGLPQNRILALTQTSDGYLWIGTPAGLARFDGFRFTIFDRSNTPAFRDDSILSLSPGRDNTLWIGSEGGGLIQYRNGAFQSFGPSDGLSNGFVRALLEDSRGDLWIGTDRGYFLRDAGGVIRRLDGTSDLPETSILSIREDARGRVWASTNQGALLAVDRVVRPFRAPGVPGASGRALLASPDGMVWLSREGEIWQLREDGKPVGIPIGKALPIALHQGQDGQLWIGTLGSGLLVLRGNSVQAAPVPDLPDQTILNIFEDRDQSLWAGTQDGLIRITRTVIHTLSSRQGLPNDNVSTIYEDRDGSLWIGAITAEMSRMAGRSGKPVPVPSPAAGFRPRIVYRTRGGDLWFGSSSEGLARVSGGTTTVFTRRHGLRSHSVRQILEDRNGRIWAALGSGLALLEGQRFRTYYLEDGLAYGSVRSLLELPGGDLLVGTDGGVSRLRDLRFVQDETFASLKGEKIWSMISDPESGVWLGTRGGGVYRLRDGALRRITTREGLPGNNVYQLLDDRQGNLWMSGSFGIASVPWKEINDFADQSSEGLAVASYGIAEGLESTEMNGGMYPAAILSRSGDIWFASVKGAVRIEPNLPLPRHRSQVLIEALDADDRNIPLTGPISIRPGRQKIQIAFTASDLLSGPQARFRYKLEGFDSGWTSDSQRRTAVYTNLPPGAYRFRVASLGGLPSEASVAFQVEPHFYQTRVFVALLILGAGLTVWGLFRLYARQTRARYAVLFAERTRLAREMHDTVIQGCVGISALLEAAVTPANGSRGQELLDMARRQIRLTLDEARQAVWDLRHKEVEGDLAASLRDFTGRFAMESPVPIGLEVSGPMVRLDGRAERNLLLVAREAIRNALSHAAPARIDLRLRFEPANVCLEVRDNGKGFCPSPMPQPGHYGIVGMRERVEELGGSLEIRSEPGQGTCLLARMPLEAQP